MAKTIHLIRHGQSTFNAAIAASPFANHLIFDAPLSAEGEQQARTLRTRAEGLGAEIVLVSPLTRAIQTALGAFGDIAPILVEPLHRERVEYSCDIGRSPAALAAAFPGLAFDHLDDPWWYTDGSHPQAICFEPEALLEERVAAFTRLLAARPERTIAVVGHGTFLRRMTGERFGYCEVVTVDL